jgi:SAM-dependent methyltransferase/alpha-beta hydrolase superfamily lysophospholipase
MNTADNVFSSDIRINRRDMPVQVGGFTTEPLSVITPMAKKIVAYLDIPVAAEVPVGIALIAPAYGETKENNLLLSAYLAANHFYGLRFDWSDHVGESEGDIFTSTLTKMQQALASLLDYAELRFSARPVGIFATSLAARVAIKLTAQDRRPAFLVCLTPVVDLRETLMMVYKEDLVGNYSVGKRYGTIDILGFSINADNFLDDAIKNSFLDLESTKLDASRITIPTFFVVGQRDSWVRKADAESIVDCLKSRRKAIISLPTVLHRLLENPKVAESAVKEVVKGVIECTNRSQINLDAIQVPDSNQIISRKVEEKKHLREQYEYSRATERGFWKAYLAKFQYVFNIPDFYGLLESIHNRLGGTWPGQKVLDAGCGVGNFGLFLLTKQLYRVQQDLQYATLEPVRYYGVDFVCDAISAASLQIIRLRNEFKSKLGLSGSNVSLVNEEFVVADLETELPFPSEFFDQACCNLVISYLQDPATLLKELWRVLRPGGRVVISSLKPNADLSEIYRNFISWAENPAEIEEGRQLLNNAGMIKLKESAGIYHFYCEKELRDIARKVGFPRAKTFRSFGNQANLIVCYKAF